MMILKRFFSLFAARFGIFHSAVAPDTPTTAYINRNRIELALQGSSKEGVIRELVDVMARSLDKRKRKRFDQDRLVADMLERERTMSTGLQYGIAVPHARTDGVRELYVAIGIKKDGVDFEALDGEPSRIFVAIASPKKKAEPHIRVLSALTGVLKDKALRSRLLSTANSAEAEALLRSALSSSGVSL
jgi:mannitol/fructose-specific phosphotransferase system IIA component (Ntr-type)